MPWAANLTQVYRDSPEGTSYRCWVLFVRHGSGSQKEIIIRGKHEDISVLLASRA